MINEQHTIEMINLMLQTRRQKPRRMQLLRLIVAIKIAHFNLTRPLHHLIKIRNGKAALFIFAKLRRISGFTTNKGFGGSFSLARSITNMRKGRPIWIAASPIPGAAYIVSSMSSKTARVSASTLFKGAETCRKIFSSGKVMIGRTDMSGQIGVAEEMVNASGVGGQ
jgi:hypothetical protein